MPLKLSPQATEDLELLYLDGVERFGRRRTESYIAALRRVFELITANPQMARLRTEITPPVRVHPHGSHLVIYEEYEGGALILRIRHARENWSNDSG